jgi:hypothetical protein
MQSAVNIYLTEGETTFYIYYDIHHRNTVLLFNNIFFMLLSFHREGNAGKEEDGLPM